MKEQDIDDFQTRVQHVPNTCQIRHRGKTFGTYAIHVISKLPKVIVNKYLTHMKYLNIKQRRCGQRKRKLQEAQFQKSFNEYEWGN